MGVLVCEREGRRYHLAADTLVGRGDYAIHLDEPEVSSPHASLRWSGDHWLVRDLGSRNGTYVDERRLAEGERARLNKGAVLRIGNRELLMDHAGAPEAIAVDVETGITLSAADGLLVLPDESHPIASIFEDADGRWICEQEDATTTVTDRQVVQIDGRSWKLLLPTTQQATVEGELVVVPTLETIELEFRVGRDEEHIELSMTHAAQRTTVPPRSFHYLLLILAREHRGDDDASDAERGWTNPDQLIAMMKIDRIKLNVDICRARKQFGELGVLGAAGVVERRPTNRAVRFGVPKFEINTL